MVFRTEEGDPLEIFTTRPDTLWGATFMVLAPEHPLVARLTTDDRRAEVEAYVDRAVRQTVIQREAADTDKTGVSTGGFAVNPVNGERIPVWIADYVLMTYGTGAIMGVPAHDQRDFEFARAYGLEIRPVIVPEGEEMPVPEAMDKALPHEGTMVNSGPLTGTPSDQVYEKVVAFLEEKGIGRREVGYRLRDWLISRQRYWGAPIPIVFCPQCGPVAVPEDDLPVLLPDDIEWLPTGESPLKLHPTWRKTTCPTCGGEAERETDTMDTFMCSSWYHLRYLSPHYDQGPFDPSEYRAWMPVDTYTGGIEHATGHLIYTRFFHKALRDLGIVQGSEPMLQLRNQGIILGEDKEKMSKSRGNVVAPDALVDRYGADTMRAYLMFCARWDQGAPWSSTGIEGTARWLRRVWNLYMEPAEAAGEADPQVVTKLRRKLHQTLRRVTADFEAFQFNTVIAALMELMNEIMQARPQVAGTPAWAETKDIYVRMLAPITPHLAEELWRELGHQDSIHLQSWPEVDEEAAKNEEITLVVQVNGKLRDRVSVPPGLGEDQLREAALATEGARRFTEGLAIRKVVVVPERLVNIVAN